MSVRVTGTGSMTTNWDNMRKRIAPKVERGARRGAETLLYFADELVPVETSALKSTGAVRKKAGGLKAEFIVGYGNKLFAAIGYGKGREKRPPHMYAVYVHQMHMKFLEIPYESRRNEMRQAIRNEIKK